MAFNPGIQPPQPFSQQQSSQARSSSKGQQDPSLLKSRRHIFQRLEDTREEHALLCHAKACRDHLQLKEKVKLQCSKLDKELLMENYHLYRTRLENAELLGRAGGVEDCHSGEQVWAMSLREHWTVEPRIGDLYSTPICYLRKGYLKDIEQIGNPNKANLHDLLSDASASKNTKQHSTLTTNKHFVEKCEKKFAKATLHKPEYPGLEVIGMRLSRNYTVQTEEKTEQSNSEVARELEMGSGSCELSGPTAELSHTKLFLNGKPGEHVSSLVTLRNTGSTSLYYKWQQQPAVTLVEATGKGPAGHCFCIVPEAGSILPGETKEFFISFHSKSAGTFIETWILDFAPKLLTPLESLNLHGVAVAEDRNSMHRKLLNRSLEIQQETRGLEEIFSEIIGNAIKQAQASFKKMPDFTLSNDSFSFMRSNQCFETPLYYNPAVFLQFEKLALEILALLNHTLTETKAESEVNPSKTDIISAPKAVSWDKSVLNLILFLNSVSDEQWKEKQKQTAADLVELAALPPHPTSVLHTAMYKALGRFVNQMEEVVEEMKRGLIESRGEVSTAEELTTNNGKNLLSSPAMEVTTSVNITQVLEVGDGATREQEGETQRVASEAQDAVENKLQDGTRNAVRLLLQKGIEQFFSEVEGAVGRLVPVVQRKTECWMAKGDEESASWVSLWFQRLTHALS